MGEHGREGDGADDDGPRGANEVRALWDVAFAAARKTRLSIEDAEDVAEASLTASWRTPRFGQLNRAERRRYVYVVAKRMAIRHLQVDTGTTNNDGLYRSCGIDPALRVALHEALASLETQQLTILERYYGEGQTESEIAEALGCPRAAVHRGRHRALKSLQARFDQGPATAPAGEPAGETDGELPSGTVHIVLTKDVG